MINLGQLLAKAIDFRAARRVLIVAWAGSTLPSVLAPWVADVSCLSLREHAKADSFSFPYAPGFNVVICDEAARRTQNAVVLFHECARILAPDGIIVLWDLVIPGPPKVARYVNTLESFRDPAHKWAYALADWQAFFAAAGLQPGEAQVFVTRPTVDEWAAEYLTDRDNLLRAHVLIRRAPPDAASVLDPCPVGLTFTFARTYALMIGHKS